MTQDAPWSLSELLAALYPDKNTALIKGSDATGIPRYELDPDGAAVVVWDGILRKAAARGKVEALVALASREFPARTRELETAAARFVPGRVDDEAAPQAETGSSYTLNISGGTHGAIAVGPGAKARGTVTHG